MTDETETRVNGCDRCGQSADPDDLERLGSRATGGPVHIHKEECPDGTA